MRTYKIFALMYADFLLVRNSKWRIVEYLYFPITTVLIYGLFSLFVSGYAAEAGLMVFIVNILWSFALLAQSHVNMSMNEDSWSGSLKQIMTSGVTDIEYIAARIISSIVLSLPVLVLLVGISVALFNTDLFITQWQAFSYITISTLVASIGLSVFIAGAMIALGREYGFLAWTALQAFVLLSAPFYPVSLFPEFIRPLVNVMPYTNIFESTRGLISGADVATGMNTAMIVALAYLAVSLVFYKYIFSEAKKRGWLTRLS